VQADIIVSGLTDAVGGASFFVSFDSSILQGTSFTLDPDNKMGFALNPLLNDFGSGFGGGGSSPFEAFFLADASLDSTALAGLQGAGFRLAHLQFKALTAGTSALALSFEPTVGAFLSDGLGNVMNSTAVNGCVVVANREIITDAAVAAPNDPCSTAAVPEPATFGLLATGFAALVRARRKSKKA
jgi:PEP-CTERM motif